MSINELEQSVKMFMQSQPMMCMGENGVLLNSALNMCQLIQNLANSMSTDPVNDQCKMTMLGKIQDLENTFTTLVGQRFVMRGINLSGGMQQGGFGNNFGGMYGGMQQQNQFGGMQNGMQNNMYGGMMGGMQQQNPFAQNMMQRPQMGGMQQQNPFAQNMMQRPQMQGMAQPQTQVTAPSPQPAPQVAPAPAPVAPAPQPAPASAPVAPAPQPAPAPAPAAPEPAPSKPLPEVKDGPVSGRDFLLELLKK